MELVSPLKKKRRQEQTVELPKRCIIYVLSGADNSTISAFMEQSLKVSFTLTFTVRYLFVN